MEHHWGALGKGVKARNTTLWALTKLWTAVVDILHYMPMEHFRKLIESMPRRVAPVNKVRGGTTRYQIVKYIYSVALHCHRKQMLEFLLFEIQIELSYVFRLNAF